MNKVSVIIPARNAASFIEETVRSVLAQRLRPHEIIIVDDGSTDGTPSIVRKYEEHGVKVLEGKGRGASAALNCGIEHASSDLIAHFDADDIMLPSKLATQVALFSHDTTNTLGLVASDLQMFDCNGLDPNTFLTRRTYFKALAVSSVSDGSVRLHPDQAMRALSREHCIDVKGVYTRQAWEAVGGFDTKLRCAYDLDFVWRVASRFDVAVVPEVLFLGRRHSNNTSANAELASTELLTVFGTMLSGVKDRECRTEIQRRRTRELRDLAYEYRNQRKMLRAIWYYGMAMSGL